MKPSTEFMEYILMEYNNYVGTEHYPNGDVIVTTPKRAMELAVSSANFFFKTDYSVTEVVNEITTIGETEA